MNIRLYSEKCVIFCLYAVLVVPLLFQHQLMHPLITFKTIIFQSLIEIIFALYCALAFMYPEYRPRLTKLSISIFGLFAVMGIASFFGVNGARSFWSIPDRMTGIILWAHLIAFFIMLTGLSGRFSWIRYLSFSTAISFLVALFPIGQLFFPDVFFDKITNRLGGTIGNPIFLSAYLIFHLFIGGWLSAQYYAGKSRWWWVWGVISFFNLIVIALTQTRSAFVALFVAALVLSIGLAPRLSRRGLQGIICFWCALIIFGGIFLATRQSTVWQSVPFISRLATEGFTATPRLIVWKASYSAFTERPALGWGWENFYAAFNQHYDPRLLRYGFSETFFDKPHNIFIQFLVETGVVGLFAYLIVFGLALWQARRRVWLVALISAYATQNFFAFDTINSLIMFFAVLAFIDTGNKGENLGLLAPRSPNGEVGRVEGVGIRARDLGVSVVFMAVALSGIYFVNYRIWRASHLEWQSVNYFVQNYIPEGLEYFDKALAAETPYHYYIGKDLYPNIALFYKQGIALPDAKNLVARVVSGMEKVIASDPLNYSFLIGFADIVPYITPLDASYLDRAEAVLAQAEATSPRRQATQYVLAKIKNLKGDKQGALAALQQAIALDPQIRDAHFYYALLLLDSGNMKEGIKELDAASTLGREPKNADEARVIAGHLGDAGFYKESQKYYQQILLLFEFDDLETKMKLGLVYYLDKQYDPARRLISEVMKTQDLKKSPQYPSLQPILRELGLEK